MRREFPEIAEWRVVEWERDYAPLNVRQELAKMAQWIGANPRRRKSNYSRFIVGWLNRAHAAVAVAQANNRILARVGTTSRPAPDYSKECAEILRKYPDLA